MCLAFAGLVAWAVTLAPAQAARDFPNNGANYLSVASSPVAALPCTIAAWINVDTTSTDTVAGLLDAAPAATGLRLDLNGTGNVLATASDGTSSPAVTTTAMGAGTWVHVCGVFAATNDRRAYLNGGGKGTSSNNRNAVGTLTSVTVGRVPDGTRALDGRLAWLSVWSVALSDDQVAGLASGRHPYTVARSSLVAFWPLGDGSDARDLVGLRNLTVGGTLTRADSPTLRGGFGR